MASRRGRRARRGWSVGGVSSRRERADHARVLRVTRHCEPVVFRETVASMGGAAKTVQNAEWSCTEEHAARPRRRRTSSSRTTPVSRVEAKQGRTDAGILDRGGDAIASEDKPAFVYDGKGRVFVVLGWRRKRTGLLRKTIFRESTSNGRARRLFSGGRGRARRRTAAGRGRH